MKGRSIPYSTEEMVWLESNRALVISEYALAFNAAFGRDVEAKNLHALRKRKGWRTGRTGCFESGQAPLNKGKKCAPGRGGNHPNARKTQYAKGVRQGVAVKLYKPVGAERVSKDGYRERKIHDGLPLQSRWRAVHLVRWEEVNGPMPKGHALKCLNGNRLDTDPANWALVSRSLLPRLAGGNRHRRVLAFDDAAPEVRPTLLAIAELEDQARTIKRRNLSPPRSLSSKPA